MEATLTLIEDGRPLKQIPLGRHTVVGRSEEAEVFIPGAGVSRRHAVIVQDRRGYFLEDMQSSNGTRVNGRLVKRIRLNNQDEIEIAGHVFRFTGQVAAVVVPSADVTLVPDAHSRTSVVGTTDASVGDTADVTERGDDALKRRLNTFLELSREVSGTFQVDELLSRIMDALFRVFSQADRGTIMLIDPDTGELVPKVVKRKRESDEGQIAVSMTVINRTIHERHSLLCHDAMSDGRFQGAASIVDLDIRSLMSAPLVAKDELVGVVLIDTTDATKPFAEADLRMLTGIAAQAAMAIRNGQLYEEKVRSERLAMVGQTIAGLAHCVKNILNGIQGGSYMVDLGMSKADEGMTRKGWDMVKRNNAFMHGLVLDMLAYAKEREPDYQMTQVNDLVRNVCELMAERASQNRIELSHELAADLRPIAVETTQIQRCVLNLVTNAIDACAGQGASVVVSTSLHEDQGEVHIAIADDGCGISEENQKRLFQVFFSTKGSSGTGLGLAVTHKIVREHRGEIDVASEEGKGTTFTIRLPLREETPDIDLKTEDITDGLRLSAAPGEKDP